ncbi:MAG: TonB family protein [Thermodesulfobacteriota bacterium]|nr:TonB family protein [Thermodesulfobacteriota bacterium]
MRDNNLKYYIIISFFIHAGLLGTFVVSECSLNRKEVKEKKRITDNTSKINESNFLDLDLKNSRLGKSIKKEGNPSDIKKGNTVNLNTTDPKYFGYLQKIRNKIEDVWRYPFEARNNKIQGKLTLKFIIDKNGTLNGTVLLKPSYYILNQESIRAVKVAAPFPPVPDEIGSGLLNIIATFEYAQ